MLSFPIAGPNDSNSPYGLYNLWNAASVILGFQFTAFAWRMTREREIATKGGPTWFPFADKLNVFSMLVSITGVFLAPILGFKFVHPAGALVVSLLLLAAYPFALAGHYDLFFKHWGRADYFPVQERVVVAIAVLSVVFVLFYFRHPVYSALILGASGIVAMTLIDARKALHQQLGDRPPQAAVPQSKN